MDKVFLCHASSDKEYVRVVAKKLGRAKVIFDEMVFEPGHDFRDEIISGLDKSSFFVFIVSRASIDSVWCRFELGEAHLRRMEGTIKSQLAIIIDQNIKFNDLPSWMRTCKAVIQTLPSQATRDVQRELFSILPAQAHKPFVGRQNLQQKYTEVLSSTNNVPPRVFVMSGLDGIGRRSYLERICRDTLGLHLGPYFIINETQGLDDIYLWILDETADLGTRANMAREIQAFSKLSDVEKVDEIVNRLHVICKDNSIPCFIDEGGMLDDYGKYKKEYATLLDSFSSNEDDHYLALLHRRSPLISELNCRDYLLHQRIKPLELHESKLLLQQLCKNYSASQNSKSFSEISEYLDGYPPAAYFTSQHIETYGIDVTVSDKSLLIDFKVRSFTRFVNDLNLSENEWLLLQYLSSEQLVPLEAISAVLELSSEETAPLLRNLIDSSLVVVVDNNFGVSPPIRAAVFRSKGHISQEAYGRIRVNLTKEFWSNVDSAPTIEIVDATLHAVAMSGSTEFDPYQDLVRASVVHRLAQECYHRKEWHLALEYSKRAEAMGSTHPDVRAIHFKSLVQQENWQEAEVQMEKIQAHRDRQAFYLKGFMLRKRQRYLEAISAFESALLTGDRSFSVHRDYAECLYREGRFKEATQKIRWALERQPENIFVLDQVIRIYIDSKKRANTEPTLTDAEAAEYLRKLERFDLDKRFIYHRKSTLMVMKGDWTQALEQVEAACESSHSPFESYALKIDILIEMGEYRQAENELKDLENRFRSSRKDIQIGLRCKLLIRQSKWREADLVWSNLENKDNAIHKSLKRRILELKSLDKSVTLLERQNAASDLKSLNSTADFSIVEVIEEASNDTY